MVKCQVCEHEFASGIACPRCGAPAVVDVAEPDPVELTIQRAVLPSKDLSEPVVEEPTQESTESKAEIVEPKPDPSSDDEAVAEDFCASCGDQLRSGVKFCTSCGSPISRQPEVPEPEPEPVVAVSEPDEISSPDEEQASPSEDEEQVEEFPAADETLDETADADEISDSSASDEVADTPNLCASCGSELRSGVKFCSECGTPVPKEPAEAPAAVAPSFCVSCGETLREGASFCRSCGSSVKPGESVAGEWVVAQGGGKCCGNCSALLFTQAAKVRDGNVRCPSCYAWNRGVTVGAAPPVLTRTVTTNFCRSCGETLADDATFCRFCGSPTKAGGVAPVQQSTSPAAETASEAPEEWVNAQSSGKRCGKCSALLFPQAANVRDGKVRCASCRTWNRGVTVGTATGSQMHWPGDPARTGPSGAMSSYQGIMPPPQDTSKKARIQGLALIGGGVLVFIICSAIQASAGTSMFSNSYYSRGVVSDILVNVTFWPGWTGTILLILAGIGVLATDGKKK